MATLKLTSLSRWFAAQSQSHRRGREGSLHHDTLSSSLALYRHFNHDFNCYVSAISIIALALFVI